MPSRYQDLETKIGLNFDNLDLLDLAFVHKSYVNENKHSKPDHNERLEFLGDAVLELIVTNFLYKNYPQSDEGDLTNWRSALVKGENLAAIAGDLNLGAYLYLSRGEEISKGRHKAYILANTLEALIGAIFLDKGYEKANEFVQKFVITRLEEILENNLHIDAKSLFQEIAQEKLNATPEYKVLSDEGPDHSKIFTVGAFVKDELIAEGKGSSKQKAEQDAANNALIKKNWVAN
jgi:ribonuclease-3